MTFRRRTGRMFLSSGGKEPKAAGALSMCPRPLTTDCLGGCGPLAVEGIPPGTGDPLKKHLTGKVRVASPPALEEPLGDPGGFGTPRRALVTFPRWKVTRGPGRSARNGHAGETTFARSKVPEEINRQTNRARRRSGQFAAVVQWQHTCLPCRKRRFDPGQRLHGSPLPECGICLRPFASLERRKNPNDREPSPENW